MAENTIDNLSIEVTASADKAASMFDRLASSAGRLRDSASGAGDGMRDMADGARDAGTETSKVERQSGRAQPKIRGVGRDAKDAGDNAKKGSAGLAVFWNALKRVGSISFKGIKGVLYDLPKYFGGRLIGNVRQAALGVEQFFKSITRIAMYRAIRSALKLITQGFSEGIQNLYAWSAAVNGSFAASRDRLAISSLYLKNSLGAMVSPLIEAVAPAVDFIVDKFVNLLNVINQVFAVLAGKTSYTAAKKVAAQWQDASDSASGSAKKAAKEIKRTLLAFDEINKLNGDTPKNGTGSGGANAAKDAGSMMFENRDISGLVRNMVEGGDFSLVGRTVADKINKAIGSINWSSIKASAVGITDSITSLINGFIQDIDPNVIGKSLAEVINTASTVIDRFWSSIEWAEAGRKTRQAIIKFFNDIDVAKAADALTAKFRSIVTYIANALPQSPQEWDLIGTKISGFISRALDRIPWPTIGDIAGNLLVGGLRVMKILADDMTLTRIATGVKTAIQSACEKITPEDVASWVNSVLKDVLSAVGVLLSIDLKFGNVTVNPLTLVAFGVAATSLLKNSIGKIFGATSVSGLGKGLAFTAGVALGVQAIVDIVDVINGIRNNGQVDWRKVGSFLKNAALSTGMFLMGTGHYKAGLVALGIGLVIEPVVNKIVDIVNDIKENGLTKENFWDIVQTLMGPIGLVLISKGVGLFKAAIGIKFGISSVAMQAATSGFGGLVNLAGLKASFISALQALFSSTLGAAFGSCLFAGGVIVLTTLIAMKIIPEKVDFEYSKRVQKNNPTDPVSMYSDPELGGNAYGTSNPSQLKYMEGFENDPYFVELNVGVNYESVANPSYKNKTLGNYIVDTMDKVKAEAQTKVSSVAGKLMSVVGNKLTPVTGNTNTVNTVASAAGKVSQIVNGKIAPITENTSTVNTVNSSAGTGMSSEQGRLKAITSDVTNKDTVYAIAGSGMTGGTVVSGLKPIVNDSTSTNVVRALAGSGMESKYSGLSAVTNDTNTTNTVSSRVGMGMRNRARGGIEADVYDTTSETVVNAKTPWGIFNAAGSILSVAGSKILGVLGLNNLSTDVSVGLNKAWGWMGALVDLGLANLSTDVDVGLEKDWLGSAINYLGLGNLFAYVTVGLRKASGNAIQFTANSSGGVITFRKNGGVFSNGTWSDIPQYAGGTTNAHGSLFLAGEAGPEIVGHVGGRTEVLNKSQLASAMYSAVHSAMNGVSLDADFHGGSTGGDSEFAAYASKEHEDMQRQNELLRQQNELLRMLYEKDNEWSTSGLTKAQQYMNRRAGTTIVPVGT